MATKIHKWFKPVRGSFLPCAWQGWLLYLPYVVLLIGGIIALQHYTSNVGFTIMLYIPWVIAWAVVFEWLARRLS